MNSKRNSVAAAAAIVAGLILSTALPASAQFRSQDGHALDANRRVGGNGSNDEVGNRTGSRVTGNQIVTGNVTGLRGFSGPVGYRDPSEFSGPTGTHVSDVFNRDTAMQDLRSGDSLTNSQAFYGQARITPPPPGYVPTGSATGGYVAAEPVNLSGIQSAWASGKTGLGANQELKNSDLALSQRFGELVLPGPTDTSGTANTSDTFISASPLYGVRLFKYDPTTGEPNIGSNDKSQGQGQDQGAELSPLDKLGLTDRGIQRMQDELNNANNPHPRSQQQTNDDQNTGTATVQGNGPRPVNPTGQNGTGTDSSTGTPNGVQQPGPMNNGVLSPGARQRLLVPPAEQSELFRALQQQYELQNANRPPNDLELAHQIQSLQTVQRQATEAAAKKTTDDNAAPGATGKPAAGGAGTGAGTTPAPRTTPRIVPTTRTGPVAPNGGDAKPPAQTAEPLNVDSLAAGVKAKGLADLLKSAEDLMKQGKFTSAIQKYELAGRVAPNNALITLGRANAELGASLYGQAENDIRRSIQTQPALLMGRYNLRGFIGEERMGFLVKDLKEISEKDPKQLRPLLLLGYIAYNSGNVDQAREYIDRGLKLASADPVLLSMREHWELKAKDADTKPAEPAKTDEKAPPAPNLNK